MPVAAVTGGPGTIVISVYDETGMTYRLPDQAESSKSSPW